MTWLCDTRGQSAALSHWGGAWSLGYCDSAVTNLMEDAHRLLAEAEADLLMSDSMDTEKEVIEVLCHDSSK